MKIGIDISQLAFPGTGVATSKGRDGMNPKRALEPAKYAKHANIK